MEINRLFDTIDGIQEKATVEAVFGPPAQVGEKTVIPIGQVTYGFGLGFGQGIAPSTEPLEGDEGDVPQGSGGGSGGGLSVQPVAVLEITPEATELKAVINETKIAKTGMLVAAWCAFCLARTLVKIFGKN